MAEGKNPRTPVKSRVFGMCRHSSAGQSTRLLRVRWSNPLSEAIYEINLKIAPLQLNTSQYLSRIEGSPPKVALQRPPQKKLNKGLQFDFDRAIIIYQTRPYSSAGQSTRLLRESRGIPQREKMKNNFQFESILKNANGDNKAFPKMGNVLMLPNQKNLQIDNSKKS